MPGKQTQRGEPGRAYSLGFELVCAVAGFVLVGVWIDRHYNSGPWGTLICLFLGLIGGFYNLFRESARLFGGKPKPEQGAGRGGDLREVPVAPRGEPADLQEVPVAPGGEPAEKPDPTRGPHR